MNKHFLFLLGLLLSMGAVAQKSDLTVEMIMQDPSWMGTFPDQVRWSENSSTIYFKYNAEADPADSLYKISIRNLDQIKKVGLHEERQLPTSGDYDSRRNKKVYSEDGKLVLKDLKKNQIKVLIELSGRISNPRFISQDQAISFGFENNAYHYSLKEGNLKKLTNIQSGKKKDEKGPALGDKDKFLKEENLELLQVVREREEQKEASQAYREMTAEPEPFVFYTGNKRVTSLQVSPDSRYVTFTLMDRGSEKRTDVPDYVDASGYTVDLPARSKVGEDQTTMELAIYHIEKDTVYFADFTNLPGIKDLPDYVEDYPDREWEAKVREIIPSNAYFANNSSKAVVNIRSKDNKDRWIAQLNLEDGSLKTLDRQRDEAWIAGPGIGYTYGGGTLGWLPDDQHIYFQSEETGYSHLYLLNVESGEKRALTSGSYEVFNPFISNDQKHWYLTTSEVHPGERHFYKMPLMGGSKVQLTSMTGNNQVSLSPDEKYMAIRHSYSNKPWELYLKKTQPRDQAKQLTSGQSEAFKEYSWRDPQLVTFPAADGAMVPARLYLPEQQAKNGAAVIFVHGAGYLQNAHKWWSNYFREYMFHNLLTDLGYTVLDIDYRGSAGYGRDWRTGIYRHMGGKDLSDQVDGVKFLVEEHDVDPGRIGIYGGSYGGFITLMALFTEADTFTSGAALRSVTDWAHYNHGYTSNILNEPFNDPIAYRRSSPIYFAEGLEGNLLIAHGMVDINVHFQDVVRLAQRLIELGKDNWEMAVYPVEDHGFVEPSSWTDEYRRILKLFEETLRE